MIQVYSPGNEDFVKNGDCTLFPQSATVHAVLGGAWEAHLVHPIDSDGRWRYLVEEAVVKMPSFNGDQLFRIRRPRKLDSGIECIMEPVFYDSRHVFLTDIRPERKTGQQALDILCAGTAFSGQSDIAFRGTAYYEYKNLLEAIAGDGGNSFVNRWGGEPIYDNFSVTINARAGSDYNAEIRYGKNLPENGMEIETDMSTVVTRIYPKAFNGYQMSEHGYVDSPLISRYAMVYPRTITYENVKMRDDATDDDLLDDNITICDTQAQLDAALVAKCRESFDAGLDKPVITVSCDMILLQNTKQYADISDLETVVLGDTVHCYNSHLDFTTSARVMELTYNSIKKRVETVTLGAFRQSFLDILDSSIRGIDEFVDRANSSINKDGTIMAERVRGFLNGAYASLHAQYNVAERQDYVAILFENLDTTSDLYGALAIGTQGLMISKRRNAAGTDWVWTTAATAAGLVANTIVTGAISDASANNYWDLDTGEFRLASTAQVGGKTVSTIASEAGTAAVNAQTQQSIFNKLTNNGEVQGIYLSGGKLYINGTYLKSGAIQIKDGDTETFYADTATGVIRINATGNSSITMKSGTINLGSGNFVVTSAGAVTIKSGSINLGSGNFVVTSAGTVTIKSGSINLGSGAFTVSSAGVMTATGATISGKIGSGGLNVTSTVTDVHDNQYVRGVYIKDGAIDFKTGSSQRGTVRAGSGWGHINDSGGTISDTVVYGLELASTNLILDNITNIIVDSTFDVLHEGVYAKSTTVTIGTKKLKFVKGFLVDVTTVSSGGGGGDVIVE